MRILINISTDSELIGYEALALGFLLATFDHHVQFCFGGDSMTLLTDNSSRIFGMVQSLDLYDIPPAFSTFDSFDKLDQQIITAFDLNGQTDTAHFDSVLNF